MNYRILLVLLFYLLITITIISILAYNADPRRLCNIAEEGDRVFKCDIKGQSYFLLSKESLIDDYYGLLGNLVLHCDWYSDKMDEKCHEFYGFFYDSCGDNLCKNISDPSYCEKDEDCQIKYNVLYREQCSNGCFNKNVEKNKNCNLPMEIEYEYSGCTCYVPHNKCSMIYDYRYVDPKK